MLAAKLARQAADEFSTTAKPRFVAGSLGPTTKSITLRGDVTFAQMRDSYYAQAKGLVEGGVDLLLIETGFDTRNVKAGLFAVQKLERDLGLRIPLMISGTVERWGAMLAGQPVDAFYASVAHADLLVHRPQLRHRSRPDDGSHPHAGANGVDAHFVLSERRSAERRRQVSGNARIAGRAAREIRRAWLAEHRRRLLRDHARTHSGHRADGRGPRPARRSAAVASSLLFGNRTGGSRRFQSSADCRRAHQRHRLAPVQEDDRRREVGRSQRDRALAGEERRAHHRRLPAILGSRRAARTSIRSTAS